jgi:electron transport complex protein RnfD
MKKTGWIVTPAPFILTRPSVSSMTLVIACTLIPQLCMLAYHGDYSALLTVAMALVGSIVAELIYSLPTRKKIAIDAATILAGLLAGLLLPSTLNPALAFMVSFVGIMVSRNLFGGSGAFWMNPVAVTVAIAFIGNASLFPAQIVTGDGIRTVGDAFGVFKLENFAQIANDQMVTGTANTGILRLFGIKLPEGYVTLFWNAPSQIPAFRYNAITLAASIILIAMNVIDWIVPLAYLATYGLAVYFFSLLPLIGTPTSGDILFAFFTGGTLFIAFYLLPEYSTNPRTRVGKIISGILAGIIAFCVAGPGGSPVGGVFTVILINAINPVIEYLENRFIASAGDFA